MTVKVFVRYRYRYRYSQVWHLTKTFAVKMSYAEVICYVKAHQRKSAI